MLVYNSIWEINLWTCLFAIDNCFVLLFSNQGNDNDSHYSESRNMDDLNDMFVNVIQTTDSYSYLPQLGGQSFLWLEQC